MRALALRRPASADVRAALVPGPRLRRRLIVVAALLVSLTALYMLWFRDSALVAVREVTVTGLSGSRDADRIRAAISSVADDMTTLNIDQDALERAATAFPVVDSIRVAPDFPSGLHVTVIEHRPAAVLLSGERRIAVAGDGTLLPDLAAGDGLPEVKASGGISDGRLAAGDARAAVRVAGMAPAPILARLESVAVEEGARGVVAQVQDGPEIVFGPPSELAAKWASAVRVLADEEAQGAAYVDVRIPDRPAAGGLPVETVEPAAPVVTETPGVVDPTLQATPEVVPEVTPETYAPVPETPVEVTPVTPVPTPETTGGGVPVYPQP